ncbi:MAG: DUF3025 domain-containing protein [Pseudomonadota bacterium]|nr:DUF3025 domain-containing protein [Pseudomonadota bacterium]
MLTIDWNAPWLQDLRAIGQPVQQRVAGGASVCQALNAAPQAAGAGIRFAPQSALPPGMGYEHYMALSGQCPTRDNLHDFFNGLCWLRFPQTKKKINQLHAAELSGAGASAGAGVGAGASASLPLRGPVRDALTVLDENAAFLLAPPLLWQALEARNWQRLFVELRPLWSQAQLVLFGHALLEKLVSPRKPITAHVYRAQPAMESLEALDAWVAADLSAAKLAAKPFIPLPVLGVPGWWPQNEEFSFYDDPRVFRPPR